MGDRGQVRFSFSFEDSTDLYLYTHWTGSELPTTVAYALNRGRSRWSDDVYLSRIIFNEMTLGEELETTGYGISTFEVDWSTEVRVCTRTKTVSVSSLGKVWTFSEFVDAFADNQAQLEEAE
jgi:hypothetical protein